MNESTPTGLSLMESRADEAIESDEARRKRIEVMEDRATSPEVAAMNGTAQLEIYGSGGGTYTDPETGDVIASPDKPKMGILEEIRRNPRYGTKEEDRARAAEDYEKAVNELLDNGYELAQAKLIQDLRADAQEHIHSLMGKLMSSGEKNPLVAKKRAKDTYRKLDEKRLALIREGGAFTAEEYARLREGEDLYAEATKDVDKAEKADETTDKAEKELSPEAEKGLEFLRKISPEHWFDLKEDFEKEYSKILDASRFELGDSWKEETSRKLREAVVKEYLEKEKRSGEFNESDVNEIIHMLGHRGDVFAAIIEGLVGKKEKTGTESPTVAEEPEKPEEPEPIPSPIEEPPKNRLKLIFAKIKDSPLAVIVWIQTRGAGRGKDGEPPIIPAVVGEAPAEDPKTDEERRKKRCWPLALGIGALALAGGWAAGKYGMPWTWGGGNKSGITPDMIPGSRGGHQQVTEFVNPVLGGHRSGITYPEGWDFHQNLPDGTHSLVTPDGHVINFMQDREGDLSPDAIKEIKQLGYDVVQNKIEYIGDDGLSHLRHISEIVSQPQG